MCFCKEMGICIVVVFLEVDCMVCYVMYVDEVCLIGFVVFKESYLNIDNIIKVVR